MGRGHVNASESRFLGYVEGLASVIGHADRVGPLHDYCLGLMAARGRKSVEPMAAHIAPHRTSAQHQSMLHFIGRAGWSDEEVLAKVREMVLPQIERHGPIEAWIVDDTGFPKKGEHSVGVSHQYCGQLGKQSNCQVAVTLSIANHQSACRWPISSICQRPGLTIARDGPRPACLKRSAFRPRMRLHSLTSAGPARPDFLAATHCSMPASVTIPSFAKGSPSWG